MQTEILAAPTPAKPGRKPDSHNAAKTRPAVDSTQITDEHGIAEFLKVSVHTLRKDRIYQKRIPFFRVGGKILYSIERVKLALLALEEGGKTHAGGRL